MAKATPREYVINERGVVERGAPSPQGKPSGSPGGGGGSSDSSCSDADAATLCTGGSWPGANGTLATDDYVTRSTGRAFFSMGGTDYTCSGTVTQSPTGRAVVLTAGHCIYDEVANQFASMWLFIADYDQDDVLFQADDATHVGGCASSTTVGETNRCWVADQLVAPQARADGDQSNVNWGSDFAFAVFVSPGQVLADGYAVRAAPTTTGAIFAFGYPAGRPWDGHDLVYCNGTTVANLSTTQYWALGCKMNGGSSGGPWEQTSATPNDPASPLVSLNSFTNRAYKGYMFGPRFAPATVNAWNFARGLDPASLTDGTTPPGVCVDANGASTACTP